MFNSTISFFSMNTALKSLHSRASTARPDVAVAQGHSGDEDIALHRLDASLAILVDSQPTDSCSAPQGSRSTGPPRRLRVDPKGLGSIWFVEGVGLVCGDPNGLWPFRLVGVRGWVGLQGFGLVCGGSDWFVG